MHCIISAMCLVAMLLFAITYITLNHANQIEAQPKVTTIEHQLPDELLPLLHDASASSTTLPPPLRDWLEQELNVRRLHRPAEWDDYELYLSLPRPGGDAWLTIDRTTGELLYERTDRGWIAFLNALHKARNTGGAWPWIIDLFAVACVC